jgi:hypothetical protein
MIITPDLCLPSLPASNSQELPGNSVSTHVLRIMVKKMKKNLYPVS